MLDQNELSGELLAESVRLMQPGIALLLTSENGDGTFNLAPFSWIKPASHYPPMLTVSLRGKPSKQRSLENILRTGEFVVNVVGMNLARELALSCQKVPDSVSKLSLVGVETRPARCVRPPRLGDARANLECRVINSMETGDHFLIVADVVAAAYDPKAFTESLMLRVEESGPCLHLQQYNRSQSQVHIFLDCASLRLVEVPYLIPDPELQALADTW